MNINIVFSVAVGFIGATIFQLLISMIDNYLKEKRRVGDLIRELEINEKKLNRWVSEFDTIKEKILLDNLKNYYGFIDFYTFIVTTTNLLQQDGLLYRKLETSQIERIQDMINYFNGAVGKLINDEINEAKIEFDKEKIINFINYHLGQVKFYKNEIQAIIVSLKK